MAIDFHNDDDGLDFEIGRALDFAPNIDFTEDRGAPRDIGQRGPPADVPGVGVERRDLPPSAQGRGRGLVRWDWERQRGDDHPGRGRGPPKDRGFEMHEDPPGRGRGKGRGRR